MASEKAIFDEKKINRITENVKASLLVEGMVPSDETIEIIKDYLKSNVSEDEAVKAIIENIKKHNK
jgi:hypothetical protein